MTNQTDPDRASDPHRAPVFRAGFCDPANRRLILIAAILASSMGFIDGTVVAIALPAIRGDLGASLPQAQWITNAYMLTLSALILLGGAMGDRFGLARIFGAGIWLFVVTSVACAFAPTAGTLIAARAAQGLGAALMVPGSLAIISRAYPRAERGRAIGIWAAASAMTTALGPVIGGLALTFGGPEMWRWIFAVNLPLGALALVLLRRGVVTDMAEPGARLDLPGAALATLGLLMLAWGLTAAEDISSGARLGWVGAGAVTLVVFILVEWRAPAPMVPLDLFANSTFSAVNLMSFMVYFALTTVLFFLPMTVIGTWGTSEIVASAAFAPLSLFIFLLSARVGRLADRIGPRPPLVAGALAVAAGYGALAMITPFQAFWLGVMPAMSLAGLGMALIVAPLSTALMASVPDAKSGTASGVNNAVTRVAGLVAVAAMGTVAAAAYAQAGGQMSFAASDTDPVHVAATNAAFQVVCWSVAGLALAGAVIALIGVETRPRDQASSSASQ